MSTDALLDLITAATQAASPTVACEDGTHHWVSEGGRRCPELAGELEAFDLNCSQAVYTCAICGAADHGEAGGPAWTDCKTGCRHRGDLEDLRALAEEERAAQALATEQAKEPDHA